jgi:hypothetical protein
MSASQWSSGSSDDRKYSLASPDGQLGKFSTSVVSASWPSGSVPTSRLSSVIAPSKTSGCRFARAA